MQTERTFDIRELCCFPQGCLIPADHQLYLATVLVPQLEAAGMQTSEWTRGALMLEEPHLSKVKGIVCRQCNIRECPFNSRLRPSDGLSDLMDGKYADRIERGIQLLAQLLPEAKKVELERVGITVSAFQMPSRKNPKLIIMFSRDGKFRWVRCEVGKHRLSTEEGTEPLLSFAQLSRKISEVIQAFV